MDDEELERAVEIVQEAARLAERPRVEIEPDPTQSQGRDEEATDDEPARRLPGAAAASTPQRPGAPSWEPD